MMNFFNTLFLLYFQAPVLSQMYTDRTTTHTISLIMNECYRNRMGECGFCAHVAKNRDQWLGSCEHSTEPHGSMKDEELIS